MRRTTPLLALLLAACAGTPGPDEVRLDRGLLPRSSTIEGVAGAELTLQEIRERHVEPRCAEAGLVMASLRLNRRPDGAQRIRARCGLSLMEQSWPRSAAS